MRRVLRPRATLGEHREAFWRGWRLVAIDGTQFSLINTPQVAATVKKARTRRGRAAFAKITSVVLLELGLHNPLAAAIGRQGESEWALGQGCSAQLPRRALLLTDRLYGVVAFARQAQAACRRVGSHFLLRASRCVKPRVIQIAPRWHAPGRPARPAAEQSEPRHRLDRGARDSRPRRPAGPRASELRLWTSWSTRRWRPPWTSRACMPAAGARNSIFGTSNANCARPTCCRVIRSRRAPKKSPP